MTLTPLNHFAQSTVGLNQSLELLHQSSNAVITQSGVNNEDGFVFASNLCHVICTSLWTVGLRLSFCEGKDTL